MAWAEKHGKRYRGCYRDASKRKRTAGWSHSKREALKLAQAEEVKIRQGLWQDPTAGRMTFSEYFETHWLPNRLREKNTIASYRSHYNSTLKESFGDIEVRRISPSLVQKWVSERVAAGVKPGTVRAHFRTLSTVLGARKGSSAVRDGLIQVNPCENVELPIVEPRDVKVYSVVEVDLLMEQIDVWWRPLVLLAADSGMRWGELMGLHVSDFTEGFKSVHVRRALIEVARAETGNGTPYLLKPRPKNQKHRFIALSPEVSAMISLMVDDRQLEPTDRLFSMPNRSGTRPQMSPVWPTGLPVGRSYFREYVWKPAHDRAAVEQRRFHDLRGSHITWLLGGNADIATVMTRVGHSRMSTTQLYLAAMADADDRALEALRVTRLRYRAGVPVDEK